MGFHVDSEAGRLRRVILHRPDLELKRLTPSNKDALLFDDVLWVRRARAGARRLRRRAARPRGRGAPLRRPARREPWTIPAAQALVLDRVFDEKEYGPLATDHLRAAFEDAARAGAGRGAGRRHDQAGVPGARTPSRPRSASTSWTWTTSCSTRCPTTSSPATPPPGSTTGSPSTRCAGRPGSARPSTSRRSTGTTRSSRDGRAFHVWSEGQARLPVDHRGRRRPGHRQRRGADRDERADHPAGRGDAGPRAVRGRVRPAPSWRSTCPSGGRSCTWTP